MKIFGLFFLLFMAWLLGAWSTMVTVGILHGSWWHVVPTMGYGTAFALDAIPAMFLLLAILFKALLDEL